MKWFKITGFLLVLSTFTISMLFCKHRILNATGATGTFCENRKNRESKYRSFLWATAQFRKNIERRVGHGNISKVKKVVKQSCGFCKDYYGIYDSQKKNVKKTLDVRQTYDVAASACGKYDIFIFVIFSGGFVVKVIFGVFAESENNGFQWTNAHKRKNVKSENVKNDKKSKLLKSIRFSCKNWHKEVFKRISIFWHRSSSGAKIHRSRIIYYKLVKSRPFST